MAQLLFLRVPHDLPLEFLNSLKTLAGFDETSFLAAHQQPIPVSVRLHPQKGMDLFGTSASIPWIHNGRYLPERPLFTADPLFHAGAYYVQEASSMLLAPVFQALFPQPKNLRVLDLCAAPGGKSTMLASLLDESSLLISNEVIRSRATILEESMTRWGYTNTWVCSNDPRDFGRIKGYFDVILVDAPCSGSGLFRKDAAAIIEWSEGAVETCSLRQQRILADVWPALKQNGVLIYATCSYSEQEGEQVLDRLADKQSVEGISVALKQEWGVVATTTLKHKLPVYRCFPDKIQGEGFFFAACRKLDPEPNFYYKPYRTAKLKQAQEASRHLLSGQQFSLLEDPRKSVFAVYSGQELDYHFLQEFLYFRKAGIRLGAPVQKDWLPEHDVALSLDQNWELPRWEMNKSEALCYLKKENLEVPTGIEKGWTIASFQGRGLGWVKVLQNRVNNYLPKHWKIRMDLPE